VLGDLPRTFSGGSLFVTRRTRALAAALVLAPLVLLAAPLRSAEDSSSGEDTVPAQAARQLAEVRRLTACSVAPTDDVGQGLVFQGRPSIEIKGRERGGDAPGTMRDYTVYALASGRIVSYVCFTNASDRKSGESIVSLAEASSRGDRLARALIPGAHLELESIKRYRAGETESVYYEARYAPAPGELPVLEPPVRLLLNATSGSLFRLDIDPDWLDPPGPPRVRISHKAAERIATVVLRRHDFTAAFGPGAVFGAVATAEMFWVHPNDWLGLFKESDEARSRLAWVVPFRVNGAAAGINSLFVDAATGLVLGGLPGLSAGQPPR